jgi:transcriptional regulator with XRE-family HTH domain
MSDIYAEERPLVLNQFAATLRRLRDEADVSQEELGDRCGLRRTEISLLERGRRAPRLCTLLLLATVVEVPIAALVEQLPAPKARRLSGPKRPRW